MFEVMGKEINAILALSGPMVKGLENAKMVLTLFVVAGTLLIAWDQRVLLTSSCRRIETLTNGTADWYRSTLLTIPVGTAMLVCNFVILVTRWNIFN